MFLKSFVEMGGFTLNHHWHGINVLSLLECALIAATLCSLLALLGLRKSKRLAALSLAGALSFATAAYAANTALSALSASGAVAGTDLVYVVQTAGTGGVKATMTKVATYINSLFSGDATVSSGGTITLKNTGPGATGPIGSTTTIPQVTIDAQGRVTALGSATAAGTVSNVATGPGVTGGPCTTTCTISASMPSRINTVASGTTADFVATDSGGVVYDNRATSVAASLPAPATTGFGAGAFFLRCNINTGVSTITPVSGTIGGAASYALAAGTAAAPTCIGFQSDGTNYNLVSIPTAAPSGAAGGGLAGTYPNPTVATVPASALPNPTASTLGGIESFVAVAHQWIRQISTGGVPTASQPACADLSDSTAFCNTTPGTAVATAAAANLSAAGGLTSTIASGTSALGTGAITSATCATVVTTSAPNTATTDVIGWGFNGDPTGVTGYTPVTTGALTIFAYPSSGNVNFKVCNLTSGSITPGAITLNWRVTR